MVYPTTIPTYGTYQWFRHRLGVQMGWGPDPDSWGTSLSQEADSILETALMSFYFPPPIDRQVTSHRWSFLNPSADFNFITGQRVYPLPDNFESFDGPITYLNDEYDPMRECGITRIEKLYSMDNSNGPPRWFATRPSTADGATEQQQEIVIYPTSNGDYEMKAPYTVIPKMINADNPYPLGGRVHAETIRLGMLAEAEIRSTGKAGPLSRQYNTRLIASVVADQRRAPELMGYNGDSSISQKWTRPWKIDKYRDRLNGNVTYE